MSHQVRSKDGTAIAYDKSGQGPAVVIVGGVLGGVVVLPLNGLTTGTINWQTFSHLAFAFRVTPLLLVWGLAFALLMGLAGGVPPAIRAARARIAVALREL